MWSLLMRDFKILPFSTNCKVNVKRTNICEAISFLLKSLVLKWGHKSIKFYLFTRSSDVFIYLFFLLLETSSKEWCFLFPICIFVPTIGGHFSWMHAKLVFVFVFVFPTLPWGPLLMNACQACIMWFGSNMRPCQCSCNHQDIRI